MSEAYNPEAEMKKLESELANQGETQEYTPKDFPSRVYEIDTTDRYGWISRVKIELDPRWTEIVLTLNIRPADTTTVVRPFYDDHTREINKHFFDRRGRPGGRDDTNFFSPDHLRLKRNITV